MNKEFNHNNLSSQTQLDHLFRIGIHLSQVANVIIALSDGQKDRRENNLELQLKIEEEIILLEKNIKSLKQLVTD